MSQSDITTPAAFAAEGFEIAVALCGLALILWFLLSPKARAALAIRLPAWNLPPIDFACFLCFAFVGATALSAVAAVALHWIHLDHDAEMVAGSAVMEGGALLGLAAFYRTFGTRMDPAAAEPGAAGIFRSGLVTFLVAAPLVDGASVLWEYFLNRMGLPEEKQDLVGILEGTQSVWVKGVLLAVAILLVPVVEELVFRGGLFRYFRTRMPRWVAVALTSALFGALHVHWGGKFEGLPSLAPLTVLAVVFCLAYERTGRIGTTIVAHGLFNLFMFYLVISGLGS